ncbi:molecular chaperone [Clostridia bacterium]|nr:molecular chaperone [Clostridia bacterium]
MPPPLRHELKFQLNMGEYLLLSRTLDTVLDRDPNGDEFNEYRIRSLYFDTPFDDALYEKLSGAPERRKYRIRIYKNSDRLIKLECKRKIGELTSKEALTIPRDLADQLIAGDTKGLLATGEPLLHAMYAQLMTRALRPVVIVDYYREAYLHPAEEIRITFDKRLRSGMRSIDLFNPNVPLLDPLPNPTVILEVKYNRILPGYIRKLLNQCRGQRLAVSKYVLCRAFDNPSIAFR